jgi:hypothetical protein
MVRRRGGTPCTGISTISNRAPPAALGRQPRERDHPRHAALRADPRSDQLLLPVPHGACLPGGLLQAYIAEEWVHHSVHFCQFKGKYFQYIKRHHLYHHSPKGAGVGTA